MSPLLITVLGLCFLLPTTFASFNWSYPVGAQQCSPFTVVVTGSVVFPLRLLIVPVGPSPLAHEVRQVLEIPFPTDSLTVNFTLPYPTNSQFVALVSDAAGYHGIASPLPVLPSTDASCFDATQDAVSAFKFSLSPTDIAECKDVRIYWDPATVQGTPSFLFVIPGSTFGPIPVGKIDTQPNLGTGFTWRPPVRATTNLIIVAGDTHGTGTGGFISSIVIPGDPFRDATGACLAPTTTSSVIQTSSTSSAIPSSSTSTAPAAVGVTVNVGAVIGGVIGGVAFLFIFSYLLHRLLQRKPEPRLPLTIQQYLPFVPNLTAPDPAFYGAPPPPPSYSPDPPLMLTPFVVSEETSHLPMEGTFTGQSGTTDVSSSGQYGSSLKGSPVKMTWGANNDNIMGSSSSWDGRP